MDFPAETKLTAIRREIAYRRRVYERRVADRKMTRQQADREVAIFEAIEADYAREVEKGRLL
jgi:hypothetical protein